MMPGSLIQFVALPNLERIMNRYTSSKLVVLLVGIGVFAILVVIVDYARMLWRRRKMVRKHR